MVSRSRHSLSAWKAAIFALLAANAIAFALGTSRSEAIDAAAWLVLLALFTVETELGERLHGRRSRMALRFARLVAGSGVVVASVGYIFEEDVLDALNSALWIGVVILLEGQLRFPQLAERARYAFHAAALALYGSLAGLVLAWLVESMWFDAYDALLWLIAFATIELDVLHPARPPTAVAGDALR